MDDAQRRRESNSKKKKTLEEDLRYWIPQLQEKNLEWLENEKSAGLIEHGRINLCYIINIPEF